MAKGNKADGLSQWEQREAKKRTTELNSPDAANTSRKRSKRKPKSRKSRSR